jgi:D-alanyl-D-alanine dipeptidase
MTICALARRGALLALGAAIALEPIATAASDDRMAARFVDLAELAPGIAIDIRYAGALNFLGRPVRGYVAPRCLLSQSAARALAQVQGDLAMHGLGLLVYDCFRPRRAVEDFVAWARETGEESTRARHYPALARSELFQRGYIAARSGHSRGSTVDLTLIPLAAARSHEPEPEPDDCRHSSNAVGGSLDMGTSFDCFDERAHANHAGLSSLARSHRDLLRRAMFRRGFSAYAKEWWHFTLAAEPFPHRYFDFEIR